MVPPEPDSAQEWQQQLLLAQQQQRRQLLLQQQREMEQRLQQQQRQQRGGPQMAWWEVGHALLGAQPEQEPALRPPAEQQQQQQGPQSVHHSDTGLHPTHKSSPSSPPLHQAPAGAEEGQLPPQPPQPPPQQLARSSSSAGAGQAPDCEQGDVAVSSQQHEQRVSKEPSPSNPETVDQDAGGTASGALKAPLGQPGSAPGAPSQSEAAAWEERLRLHCGSLSPPPTEPQVARPTITTAAAPIMPWL